MLFKVFRIYVTNVSMVQNFAKGETDKEYESPQINKNPVLGLSYGFSSLCFKDQIYSIDRINLLTSYKHLRRDAKVKIILS